MGRFKLEDIIAAYELGKSTTSKRPKEKVIFHGGCLTCISQKIHGIERCSGCMYKRPDWSKPDLSIKE